MCKKIAVKVNHFKKVKSIKITKTAKLQKTVHTVEIGLKLSSRTTCDQKETLKCPNEES